jgi:hypothetical protein
MWVVCAYSDILFVGVVDLPSDSGSRFPLDKFRFPGRYVVVLSSSHSIPPSHNLRLASSDAVPNLPTQLQHQNPQTAT